MRISRSPVFSKQAGLGRDSSLRRWEGMKLHPLGDHGEFGGRGMKNHIMYGHHHEVGGLSRIRAPLGGAWIFRTWQAISLFKGEMLRAAE